MRSSNNHKNRWRTGLKPGDNNGNNELWIQEIQPGQTFSQRLVRNILLLDLLPDGALQIDGILCRGGFWQVGHQVVENRKIINRGRTSVTMISLIIKENPRADWWVDWPKEQGIVSDTMICILLNMISQMNQAAKTDLTAYRRLLLSLLQEPDEKRASLRFQEFLRIQSIGELISTVQSGIPSVPELAGMTGVKPFRFQVGFRVIFGLPVWKVIQQLKMKWAYRRLMVDDQPLSTVAEELNYRHSANLGTAFRRYFGLTAGQAKRYFFP